MNIFFLVRTIMYSNIFASAPGYHAYDHHSPNFAHMLMKCEGGRLSPYIYNAYVQSHVAVGESLMRKFREKNGGDKWLPLSLNETSKGNAERISGESSLCLQTQLVHEALSAPLLPWSEEFHLLMNTLNSIMNWSWLLVYIEEKTFFFFPVKFLFFSQGLMKGKAGLYK